jgi:phosphoribosylanthranilate isomerase
MVVGAGADLFGLIFVPGARRHVEPNTAREIVAEVRRLGGPSAPRAVGVFLGATSDEINRVADIAGLDFVQCRVGLLPDLGRGIERPVVAVLHPPDGSTAEDVQREIETLHAADDGIAGLMLDTHSSSGHGGTGVVGDWALAAAVARRHGIVLAGGLNPGNVAEAILTVRPTTVDVSSGVEVDGEKDPDLIHQFVRNARAAFAEASIGQVNRLPVGQAADPVQRS